MTTFASDGTPKPEPAEPQPAAGPSTVEPVPAAVPAASGADTGESLPAVQTANTDVAAPEDDWPHDWLEFKGDTLAVRVPTPQAMAALSQGLGKFIPPQEQNDISGLFIARHLSPQAYARVFSRLMDPDDADYDPNTIGELVGALLNAGVEKFKQGEESANSDTPE